MVGWGLGLGRAKGRGRQSQESGALFGWGATGPLTHAFRIESQVLGYLQLGAQLADITKGKKNMTHKTKNKKKEN